MSDYSESLRETCLQYVRKTLLDRSISAYTKVERIREIIPFLEAVDDLEEAERCAR